MVRRVTTHKPRCSARPTLTQSVVAGSESATSVLRVNKTARLLRFTKLLKLMRLVRVRRILERYEQVLGVLHSTAGNSFQVFKLTAGIFLGGPVSTAPIVVVSARIL